MMCGWCGVWCNGSYCSKYCRNRAQEEAERKYSQGPSIDDYYVAMQKDMEEQYERDMQEEYEKIMEENE